MTNPDEGPYGPDAFMDENPVDLNLQVNGILPGSSGGPIEATKRAVVSALRDAIKRTDLRAADGKEVYVDLEYPLLEEQYPGIWVQFSIDQWVPAGIGHEIMTQTTIDGKLVWTPIQAFTYMGKVILSIVAVTNLDRDRLSDAIMTMISFSRTPEVWVTQPQQDTKQFRTLIAALNENPYVSVTPNFASMASGGQGAELGVPWQPDRMAYTDSFSFELLGQSQVRFDHDGAYTLERIDIFPTAVDSVPPGVTPTLPPVGQGANVVVRTSLTL